MLSTFDESGPKPIHLIFHIPKCAGQTIHSHLSTFAPKGTYHRLKKRKGPSRFFLPCYRLAGMPDLQGLRSLSGHFIGNSIESLLDGRQIARSILLRDPVSHFVSHYNFRMMRYLSQGLQAYSPEIAYRARSRNFITNYILKNFLEISWPRLLSLSAAEKLATVSRFLSTFWFVGDYTRCNELIAALAPDLGVPATAMAQNTRAEWQCRVRWKPLTIDSLSNRMVTQIRQENMLDRLLWETWCDADQAGALVHPHEIGEVSLTTLVAGESLRLVNQVRRRFYRGWKVARASVARPSIPTPEMG